MEAAETEQKELQKLRMTYGSQDRVLLERAIHLQKQVREVIKCIQELTFQEDIPGFQSLLTKLHTLHDEQKGVTALQLRNLKSGKDIDKQLLKVCAKRKKLHEKEKARLRQPVTSYTVQYSLPTTTVYPAQLPTTTVYPAQVNS